MRGADVIVQTLIEAGVSKIFSLSGNQIMPIFDACIDADIEIIHTRHEAAAVFMADAYGQLTGKVGVAMVSAGPGTANAVGPLYSARSAESPVLLLSGDTPLSQEGMGGFQSLDQVSFTAPLTKLSFRSSSVSELANDIARGIQTALSGRPGPVHLVLPADIIKQSTKAQRVLPTAYNQKVMTADSAEVESILTAISSAHAPIILCGPAMHESRSGDMLKNLSDAIDAPVLASESPRGLNDPALGDFAKVLVEVDLIISLGKAVDFGLGFGKTTNAKTDWIIVDAEEEVRDLARLNLGSQIIKLVAADPRSVASDLLSSGTNGDAHGDWRSKVGEMIAARSYSIDNSVSGNKVGSAALCQAVQQRVNIADESVVVADGGEFGQWAQAVITQSTHRVINGPSANIGGALCFALAAKKAKPDAIVYALTGDGALGFNFAEFETAVREKTPFVLVIGNDESWFAELQLQMREYGPDRLIGCELSGARYDLAVEGLGGHGEYVTDLSDLEAALIRAENSEKPACVNVAIERRAAPSMF